MTHSGSKLKFQTDLQNGKDGEQQVYDFLSQFNNVAEVIDVSDNPDYQRVEIDAIVKFTNRPPISVEIKTDFYEKTGNIVFEVFSSKTKGTAGGFVKTQSDFILYFFPNIRTLYAINSAAFKTYVLDNKNKLRYCNMGDNATGFVIPITKLEPLPWFRKIMSPCA